mmetsp:Transcript_17346/g.14230  ORF Transcript_17346/g.14230 Transcript_17346/m.14230 type:complete len:203 (+) Transcript_17346:798-1406(+)
MKEVIHKTTVFSEKIEETTSQMIRYDEMILDCAKNIDIRDLKNKINACLKIEKYEAFKSSQSAFNSNLQVRTDKYEEQFTNIILLIGVNAENVEQVKNDMDVVKERQVEVITQDDLNELRERVEVKADKLDLVKMYDLKANKLDISSLIKTLDEMHKHNQSVSQVSVSIISNLLLESKNKVNDDTKFKNRNILLNHAIQLNN